MKATLIAAGALAAACMASAQTAPEIQREPLGSGEPGTTGYEAAVLVFDNVWHVPQYLPGSPTAASIWPRAIPVRCTPDGTRLLCEGYEWTPALGRGEYLYFIPVIVNAGAPQK